MRKIFFVVIAFACAFVSCSNKTEKGDPEKDSLNQVIDGQQLQMSEMNLFLDAVNASMDSIVNMDGEILRVAGESPKNKRERIKQNIDAFKMILDRQRERLSKLEEALEKEGNRSQKLIAVIKSLRQQIEEKDELISYLYKTIDQKDFDIKQLEQHVENLNQNVADLKQETREKDEALTRQTDAMNEAYVFIGDKKQLKDAGLLSGGTVFKKSKLDMSAVDASKFRKIDIRQTTSFNIPGKKPTILTQAPAGSYVLVDNGNGTTLLRITDPAKFWSVTNFLVVRY